MLDRFHVIRWFAVRDPGPPRRLKAPNHPLRRGDTLTDADRVRLDALFDAHPRLRAGWQALQELHGLFADDYDGALKADGSCDLYE